MQALQNDVQDFLPQTEARRAERTSIFSQRVTVEHGGEEMEVSGIDLSARGVSVWAPHAAQGEAVRVTLRLGEWLVLSLDGRVARQFESEAGAVWGIEFELDEAQQLLEFAFEQGMLRAA